MEAGCGGRVSSGGGYRDILGKLVAWHPRCLACASGGIGRRAGFRCQCLHGRGGSSPPSRTERRRPRIHPGPSSLSGGAGGLATCAGWAHAARGAAGTTNAGEAMPACDSRVKARGLITAFMGRGRPPTRDAWAAPSAISFDEAARGLPSRRSGGTAGRTAQERVRCAPCDAYASRTASLMRPRSDTSRLFSRAHSRIARRFIVRCERVR